MRQRCAVDRQSSPTTCPVTLGERSIDGVELARLLLKAVEDVHKHGFCHKDGPTVFHYIEGEIHLMTPDMQVKPDEGQLAYLETRRGLAVTGVQDSVVLLTTAHA